MRLFSRVWRQVAAHDVVAGRTVSQQRRDEVSMAEPPPSRASKVDWLVARAVTLKAF